MSSDLVINTEFKQMIHENYIVSEKLIENKIYKLKNILSNSSNEYYNMNKTRILNELEEDLNEINKNVMKIVNEIMTNNEKPLNINKKVIHYSIDEFERLFIIQYVSKQTVNHTNKIIRINKLINYLHDNIPGMCKFNSSAIKEMLLNNQLILYSANAKKYTMTNNQIQQFYNVFYEYVAPNSLNQ